MGVLPELQPTLAPQLLAPVYRANFAFSFAGKETVRGVPAVKVTFTEPRRPTLIALNGADLPAAGTLWLRSSDGIVVQTRLTVQAPRLESAIEVQYARDAKVDLSVPMQRAERHTLCVEGGQQRITASAEHRNYRRFETGGRLLPQEWPPPIHQGSPPT